MTVWYQQRAFSVAPSDPMHVVVRDEEAARRAFAFLEQQPLVAVDTETSGLAWYRHARAAGIAAAGMTARGPLCFYFPFRHLTGEQQLPRDLVMRGMASVLHNPRITKVLHNIKFDEHILAREGLSIVGPRRDTSIEGHLLDENSPIALKARASTDLQDPRAFLFERVLDAEVGRLAGEAGMGLTAYKDRFGYAQVDVALAGTYAAWDVDFTLRLAHLYEQKGVLSFFRDLYQTEMDLTRVLFEMEEWGTPLDRDYLTWLHQEATQLQEELVPQITSAAGGYVFNPASDEEVAHVLSQRLRLPLHKVTDGGSLSVDVEVLTEFAGEHPVCDLLLKWREAQKIRATYTLSLFEFVGDDGLLHGSFKQVGTNTGRLSAERPNMQNFPSDDDARAKKFSGKSLEDGGVDPWSVKRAFTNRSPDFCRGYWDYSQIELRVLAFYSQDPVMREVYERDEDIHTRTSLEVYGTAEKAFRRRAKVINFGLMYLMSSRGYARQAGVSVEQGERDMARYFEKFPRIPAFRQELFEACRSRDPPHFVNLFGRVRRLPGLRERSDNPEFATRAERQCVGSYVQGTAAELTKASLVRIWKWEQANRSGMRLVGTIHDEISADMPKRYAREITGAVVRCMEDFPQFAPIPITTDAEFSVKDWSEKHKFPKEWINHVWHPAPRA